MSAQLAPNPQAVSMKGVARLDTRGNHGYMVSFRLPGGGTFKKYFGDKIHGDAQASLSAAIRCRDEVARTHDIPLTGYRTSGRKAHSNTGVQGVSRTVKKGRPFFVVTWHPDTGASRYAVFPVRGKDEAPAFDRAVRFRRARERAHWFDLDAGASLYARLREIVPDYLRPETRDELVQEMALAVLDGRITPEELCPTKAREALRNLYRATCDRWRLRSLDEPIGDGDLRLCDVLEG